MKMRQTDLSVDGQEKLACARCPGAERLNTVDVPSFLVTPSLRHSLLGKLEQVHSSKLSRARMSWRAQERGLATQLLAALEMLRT